MGGKGRQPATTDLVLHELLEGSVGGVRAAGVGAALGLVARTREEQVCAPVHHVGHELKRKGVKAVPECDQDVTRAETGAGVRATCAA